MLQSDVTECILFKEHRLDPDAVPVHRICRERFTIGCGNAAVGVQGIVNTMCRGT